MTRTLRIARAAALLAGLAAGLGGGLAGCFDAPQPGCAFSCVADGGRCPTGYSCRDDGLCHREDGVGSCDLPPQVDAGPGDTATDSTIDGDATP